MKNPHRFYIYEHWRPDKDVCFYVGKGTGRRAGDLKNGRSRYHVNIQKKLSRLGMCAEVRMVASGLTEAEAYSLEIERIAFWRGVGVRLANLTDGGGGPLGIKYTEERKARISEQMKLRNHFKGKTHSPETIRKLSALRIGSKMSAETKEKISRSGTGKKRSAETKARISAGQIGQAGNFLGKRHRPETIEKMRAARTAYWAAKKQDSGEIQ